MTDVGGSNAEDLFPIDKVTEREQERKALKPWHKPRKQWIRVEQWAAIAKCLISDLKLQDRPFKYLTLPGEEMFDIRILHDVCVESAVQLKFLGFDVNRKTEVNIASHEVGRLPNIDKTSHLYPDRVQLISQMRSLAAERMRAYCGFDAINLDFCDSIGGREAGTPDTHLEAIQSIISLQTAGRTEPWVLFVTSRCDRRSVRQSVRSVLARLVLNNVGQHYSFGEGIRTQPFALDSNGIEAETREIESLDEKGHLYTFAIGFSKWLIKLSMSAWHVKQDLTAGYRIDGTSTEPDMLSLAFRFERIQPPVLDHSGLVPQRKGASEPQAPSEEQMALAALNQYRKLVDVDLLLHRDQVLRERMILGNADLMAQARYDAEEVRAWCRENCWEPTNRDD